ncbi:hypothetical protein QAD02_007547 [Eretmocerus hayati]|uniref:Uncharacterized protein n=1 Tax=Eretmocerus hayati TaxID=131215 RepID=A0ACC2N3Y4_9HYME|nr:hypothetical protein QAD02_007547 [Eretmocerus hayati]
MRDEFYVVLKSNNSSGYFPENHASSFTALLPHELQISGSWNVALVEVQYPQTCMHLRHGHDKNRPNVRREIGSLHGIYTNIEDFIGKINKLDSIKDRLLFTLDHGRFVEIQKICKGDTCYELMLSENIRFILGDDSKYKIYIDDETKYRFHSPASLDNGSISILSVYSDVCMPYIVGNSQSPLLDQDTYQCKKLNFRQ